jgi:hypothetical protein
MSPVIESNFPTRAPTVHCTHATVLPQVAPELHRKFQFITVHLSFYYSEIDNSEIEYYSWIVESLAYNRKRHRIYYKVKCTRTPCFHLAASYNVTGSVILTNKEAAFKVLRKSYLQTVDFS